MAPLRPGERDPVVDAALDAMDAAHLRELIRALIPWLDDATQARLMNEVVGRAARASSGWAPTTPTEGRVSEIEAFAAAALRVHQVDPSDVDDALRGGTHAFPHGFRIHGRIPPWLFVASSVVHTSALSS